SLEKLNPIIKELGLQAGMELKIPKQSALADATQPVNTANLSIDITNRSTKNVAIMLPFKLNTINASNKKSSVEKSKILQITLDLYTGIKMAIDSVQKLGIPVQAQIFDTQQSSAKINAILRQNNFRN